MLQVDKKLVEVDVLIAGGGIAGLMAGIRAAGEGVSVAVVEKANTKRSGSGATGNDHFCCYIPEVHGDDMGPILWEDLHSLHGDFQDPSLARLFLEQTYDRVKDWDRWGISMRPKGRWDFSGHAYPGRPRIFLKYAGYNQKAVLTEQAKKQGVRILNHHVVTDVIVSDGEVVGALGISTQTEDPVLKVFRAKAVILATGAATRLYPSTTPGWMFNIPFCPVCTGKRKGHRLPGRCKARQHGNPQQARGPQVSRPLRQGDLDRALQRSARPHRWTLRHPPHQGVGGYHGRCLEFGLHGYVQVGKGPVYIDCTETADEDIEYMMWGLVQEGNTAMLDYMKKEGIDVRKHRVEFRQYEPFLIGSRGIEIDQEAETNVAGLYAAGDDVGNFRADLSGAATFGWIAGKSASDRAKKLTEFRKAERADIVEKRISLYSGFTNHENGAGWKEANLALQQIMQDYAGVEVRSETLLKAGLKYLRDLREKAKESLMVRNAHELMRALETFDLMDCGEVILLTALERKETRGMHRRSDYPFTNPLLQDKFLSIQRRNGKTVTRWREKR